MEKNPILDLEKRNYEYFRQFVSDDPKFLTSLDQIISRDKNGEIHVVDEGRRPLPWPDYS